VIAERFLWLPQILWRKGLECRRSDADEWARGEIGREIGRMLSLEVAKTFKLHSNIQSLRTSLRDCHRQRGRPDGLEVEHCDQPRRSTESPPAKIFI
jgi:hypothetical protein